MTHSQKIHAVLFDLDGTLLDTAPDLAFTLNTLLKLHGHQPLPFETLRPLASDGAGGLVSHGFQIDKLHPHYEALRKQFLEIYETHLTDNTQLFPGMENVLSQLESLHIQWGVVTNKLAFLTHPLLDHFGLSKRAACVVSGDTTPHAKPHPAPLHFACETLQCAPADCIFVGDSQCDIEAGLSAGMQTVIATYGYVTPRENFSQWNASGKINTPSDLLSWFKY